MPGEVKIGMQPYIKNMIKKFPYKVQLKRGIESSAAKYLFKVNKKAQVLDKQMAEIFHTTAAQALFLSLKGRPDIQ